MKFYGNGIVWDKEKNKPLCRFVSEEFETYDMEIGKKLFALGYECLDAVLVECTSLSDIESQYVVAEKDIDIPPKPKPAPRKKKVTK